MRKDQCSTGNTFRRGWTLEQAVMTAHDAEVLRELAKKLRAYAERPEEQEKMALWRDQNDLKPTRPVIYIDLENGWNELMPQEFSLECEGEMAQEWEMWLRKEIIYAEKMKV